MKRKSGEVKRRKKAYAVIVPKKGTTAKATLDQYERVMHYMYNEEYDSIKLMINTTREYIRKD